MDNQEHVTQTTYQSDDAAQGSGVRVLSERLGVVYADEGDLVEMSTPIPGFPASLRYCLIPTDEAGGSPFLWLQSMDEPSLAFIAVAPFEFFPEYDIELPRPDQEELDIQSVEDVLVLTLVTIPPGKPEDVTANLVAPVVVNTRTRRGRQVILYDSGYTTRHYLLPHEEDVAAQPSADAEHDTGECPPAGDT